MAHKIKTKAAAGTSVSSITALVVSSFRDCEHFSVMLWKDDADTLQIKKKKKRDVFKLSKPNETEQPVDSLVVAASQNIYLYLMFFYLCLWASRVIYFFNSGLERVTVRVTKRCKPFNYTTDMHWNSGSGVCACACVWDGPDLAPALCLCVCTCIYEWMLSTLCRCAWVCACEMQDVPVIPGGQQLASSPVVRHEAQSKHNSSWQGQSSLQSVCWSISYCCSFFFLFTPPCVL